MQNDETPRWVVFALGICAGLVLVVMVDTLFGLDYASGYRRGQIDALLGTVKYEKVEHEDQTVTWERIKEQQP